MSEAAQSAVEVKHVGRGCQQKQDEGKMCIQYEEEVGSTTKLKSVGAMQQHQPWVLIFVYCFVC